MEVKVKNDSCLPTALLILFITLKLCHVISWSWWWVFSPVWIPLIVVIISYILLAILK